MTRNQGRTEHPENESARRRPGTRREIQVSAQSTTTVGRSLEDRLESFAEAWKPKVGDKLVGVVVDVDLRASDYGDPYPIVTVQRDDGTEVAFHGFHTVARRELAKKRPQIGDKIGIAYFGKGEPAKPGMSGAELYKVIVEQAEPPSVDWDAVAANTDEGEASAPTAPAATTVAQYDDTPF